MDPPLTEVLSYCNTCQIVRPPRSFHCSDCGFCVEVHDHHCPWMGTCIGYRNLRHFVCFLVYTAVHSLLTVIIAAIFLVSKSAHILDSVFGSSSSSTRSTNEDPPANDEELTGFMKFIHIANVGVGIYSLAFFLMLAGFACSMHYQVMDNVTTNEQIRKKWNAKNREGNRQKAVSGSDKFRHVYLAPLPVSRI